MRSIFCMAILASLLVIAGCATTPETQQIPGKGPKQDQGSRPSARATGEEKAGAGDRAAEWKKIPRERRSQKVFREYSQPHPVPAPSFRPLAGRLPHSGAAYSRRQRPRFNTESYDRIYDNAFKNVADAPVSTFSVDVDTASYSIMRRFLHRGTLPPKDSVRIEELINYFPYAYQAPNGGKHPFSVNVEVAGALWNPERLVVRIGIKGREIQWKNRALSNLVFLLDVSGSMRSPNKLPLLKRSLKLLVDNLGENDRVAIVVYAGAAGLVLPPTTGERKEAILAAIDRLAAGGSTNGGRGIQLAYKVARREFITGGINRVILATDGDFNVGTTSRGALVRLIEKEAKSGVFLTVLGYGMGNYKGSTLERLAGKGNGNYAYIDTISEARKVLVEQIGGTMITIAKDVKIQVEFNPALVTSYRLIGYENRILRRRDFNDDTKDAGDIGAGHTVTALYEIVPAGKPKTGGKVDPLKYQQRPGLSKAARSGEMMTVKLRYKQPQGSKSTLIVLAVKAHPVAFGEASEDFRFASAVASFGMLLRDSEHKGNSSYARVLEVVEQAGGKKDAYRREFAALARKAAALPVRVEKR